MQQDKFDQVENCFTKKETTIEIAPIVVSPKHIQKTQHRPEWERHAIAFTHMHKHQIKNTYVVCHMPNTFIFLYLYYLYLLIYLYLFYLYKYLYLYLG